MLFRSSIGLKSTEDNRRSYRELLFRTAGMEEFISGVILYDETIRQSADDGTPLPQILSDRGIIPGIKSDSGVVDLSGFPGEKVTGGLDGLADRLTEWGRLGARFRSEEHTSELQSLVNLVCRLLLEKKNSSHW